MPVDANLITAIGKGTGYFTTLVKVTAKASQGGDVFRFALHTENITFESEVYQGLSFLPSKMQLQSEARSHNATLEHWLIGEFTRNNIKGGKWQGAVGS